ncbi:hypothetical protein AN958_03177 [Leucoagaricus sp. SymC.cos]|nr:hypothetical protein AN958_03177 [Leucoagaricus sp. SymC.cos]
MISRVYFLDSFWTDYRHYLNTVCARQKLDHSKGECTRDGPEENSTWTCKMIVNTDAYVGSSTSKDKAYEQAAKKALKALQEKYGTEVVSGDFS